GLSAYDWILELAMRTTPLQPEGTKWHLDAYLELPDDGKRYQVLDGNLEVTAAPTPRHQKVSQRLESLLILELQNPGKGEVYHAPIEVIFDHYNIVQPDLLFIRSDRLSIVGEKSIQGAPDLWLRFCRLPRVEPTCSSSRRSMRALAFSRIGSLIRTW